MKKIFYMTFFLIALLTLSACSNDGKVKVDTSKVYEDERKIEIKTNTSSDFILATSKGILQLYDVKGKVLDTLNLGGSKKSEFIYCEDSGEIYSRNILDVNAFNSIFYAVDKADGKLYVIQNSGGKLKKVETKSLKASKDIVEIQAYNGVFFYLVKGNGIKANEFTVNKLSNVSGLVNFMKEVGVARRGKTYSFIYVENLSAEYIKHMDLDKKLKTEDISNLNLTAMKKECIRIPYDIDSWAVTNNSVVYFAEGIYGDYNLDTNILTACYGTDSSIQSIYRPGRYSNVFALNQMGNNSEKNLLIQVDTDDLSIGKVVEFKEEIPLDMYIDNNNNLAYIIYKLNNQETYGKLRIYNLSNWKEINNITFDFVPTEVKGHNGYYYVMNKYEDFLVYGLNGEKTYNKISKYINDDSNANTLLMCNVFRKDYFLYDANGRYIDENANLLDYRGNLVNGSLQKVNRYGQLLDAYGRALNANGELVDRYGNIVDENGKIIQYTKQPDGYYRSANGTIVDKTGKAMIQLENGTYVEDVEEIPELEWHYDENGKIIINADYLAKYPDAASWIDFNTGKVTKGEYVEENPGEAEQIEIQADKTTLDKFIDFVVFWK